MIMDGNVDLLHGSFSYVSLWHGHSQGCTNIFWARGRHKQQKDCTQARRHREGNRFSRYWYKERCRLSHSLYKERYRFQAFGIRCKVRYTFPKNGYKVGYTFSKIGIRDWYVFDVSMAGLRPKVG